MAKKLIGKIVEWDAERGFGFMKSGSARVFLHRRDFIERRKDIELGDRITFLMGVDAQGRPCAKWAGHVGHGGSLTEPQILLLVGLIILPGIALSRIPGQWMYAGGYLVGINLFTFLFYFHDKKRARNKGWRIPEARLHLLKLLGGWPAAFISQRILRHKTSKLSYQIIFWLIVSLYQYAAFDVINDGPWTRKILDEIPQAFRCVENPGARINVGVHEGMRLINSEAIHYWISTDTNTSSLNGDNAVAFAAGGRNA